MATNIEVSRTFDAPVEAVWALWTDPELIKGWWGPDRFTCPLVRLDLREGGVSLVSMKAAAGIGGQEFFSSWRYVRIVRLQRIEFIQNLCDPLGNRIDPVAVGMPPDFPVDIRTVVTFTDAGGGRTQMVVVEQAEFGSMSHFAQLGLEQSVRKMTI
ncbi:MAG TPA: SRPBCC domain-containing protein [Puia sp.]|nr:SRPBCC domain-containing protein [Puia sp.]